MANDTSGDEYEDDLEAEEDVELVVVVHPESAEEDPVEVVVSNALDRDEGAAVAGGEKHEANFHVATEETNTSVEREEDVSQDSTQELLGPADSESAAEAGQALPRQENQEEKKPRRGPKRLLEAKDLEIAALTRKLSQAKKANVELNNQLQRFSTSEVVLQLENRVKEKNRRIDELMRENRTLKNAERLLAKEIEALQNSKDDFPSKKRALQEELRVCKERIKQLKEQHRVADEKAFKLHQHSFDLAVKNKSLSEKVRLLEGASASMSLLSPAPSTVRIGVGAPSPIEGATADEVQTIIASQEEEITRLHQRVALLKKTHKAEQAKAERLLKASQDEIEQTRLEMDEFYQQLFAKERAARVQFLHMKKLKQALHELALTQQTNQRFQPFLANREMRLTNRSNGGSRPNQVRSRSPQRGPALNPGRWIHEALHHLGFVMPVAPTEDAAKAPSDSNTDEQQASIPANCVQGKLVPVPPPVAIGFPAGGASTRAMLYNRSTPGPPSGSNQRFNQTDVGHEDEDDDLLVTVEGAGETAPPTPENPDEEQ